MLIGGMILPKPQVEEGDSSHGLDDGDSTRQDAGIVPTSGVQGSGLSVGGYGFLFD